MNPYRVLGVNPSDDIKVIKARYRELSRKHHPDAGGNPDVFKQITQAWSIIRDGKVITEFPSQSKVNFHSFKGKEVEGRWIHVTPFKIKERGN